MKLYPECIKEVMIFLEDKIILGEDIFLSTPCLYNYSENFSNEEFIYHLGQCKHHKLIFAQTCHTNTSTGYQINNITPEGHAFLNTIREQSTWDKSLHLFKKAKVYSLDALIQISTSVASAQIAEIIKKNI